MFEPHTEKPRKRTRGRQSSGGEARSQVPGCCSHSRSSKTLLNEDRALPGDQGPQATARAGLRGSALPGQLGTSCSDTGTAWGRHGTKLSGKASPRRQRLTGRRDQAAGSSRLGPRHPAEARRLGFSREGQEGVLIGPRPSPGLSTSDPIPAEGDDRKQPRNTHHETSILLGDAQ